MTSSGQTHSPHHVTPSRRTVLQTAAWSVPVISLAVAAPAYAASGPGQELVTFKSSLFWRPTAAEITKFDESYWTFIPEATIIWVTEIINPGPPMSQNVQLDLAATKDTTKNRDFEVLDAAKLAVTPLKGARPASGRLALTIPRLLDSAPRVISVAIHAPDTVRRGADVSWPLSVTPPASGTTVSLPIMTYTQFRALL